MAGAEQVELAILNEAVAISCNDSRSSKREYKERGMALIQRLVK